MCGIFAYYGFDKSSYNAKIFKEIALRAGRRGSDSCGLAWKLPCVDPQREVYAGNVESNIEALTDPAIEKSYIRVGHARLGTTGKPGDLQNAQPLIPNAISMFPVILAHNGNIPNYLEIQRKFNLTLKTQCDSEVLAHLLRVQAPETFIQKTNHGSDLVYLRRRYAAYNRAIYHRVIVVRRAKIRVRVPCDNVEELIGAGVEAVYQTGGDVPTFTRFQFRAQFQAVRGLVQSLAGFEMDR